MDFPMGDMYGKGRKPLWAHSFNWSAVPEKQFDGILKPPIYIGSLGFGNKNFSDNFNEP